MDWVIDAGNTRLRWAVVEAGRIREQMALPAPATPGAIGDAWRRFPPPDRLLVASVGPPTIRDAIARTARALWKREPTFLVTPDRGWGVTVAYRHPASFGIDRFAALVAAHRRSPSAALVVDIGTAMTIDILVAGRHWGGYIVPGPDLMARSLEVGTAELQAGHASPVPAPGRETATAMERGIGHALVGSVAEVRTHLAAQGLSEVTCLLTGGNAFLMRDRVAAPRVELPGLVLEGLARMAAEPMDSDACGSSF